MVICEICFWFSLYKTYHPSKFRSKEKFVGTIPINDVSLLDQQFGKVETLGKFKFANKVSEEIPFISTFNAKIYSIKQILQDEN